jgi:RNA polymerase sigma-70 factor (sigma-E family)
VEAVGYQVRRAKEVEANRSGPRTSSSIDLDNSFGAAMTDHGARLARLAFYLCGDRTRAEDLVASAFAATWPKWSAGRVDALLPYLRRAVVNLAAKERRHRLVVFRHVEQGEPPAPAPGADEGLPARIDLARCLQSLPAAQRVVVVLRYLEDLSEMEIATLLDIAPGTVKSRLARALETLRRQLQGDGNA